MRTHRRLAALAAAGFLLTACGSGTAPTAAPTSPTSRPTSNHFVAGAALAACRSEVQLVTSAEDAANALDGGYVPLRQLVPAYLSALPAYVGSWDMAAGKPVIGGGTSTKVAPRGCG